MNLRFQTAMGAIVTKLSWAAPTEHMDGTAYTDEEHLGYELGRVAPDKDFQMEAFVSIPAALDVTEWPLAELGIEQPGKLTVALRTVMKDGTVSNWSNSADFEVVPYKIPLSPSSLTVY
jgi:hypothetical protein